MDQVTTVPPEVAERICQDIRAARRWYHLALWQCWGCVRFSGGDPQKMCGAIVGCNLVVSRYRKQSP